MDFQNVIITALGTLFTTLIVFLVEKITNWFKAKIVNERYHKIIDEASDIVGRAVKTIFQTYVESLKNKNMFTEEAQAEALQKASAIVMAQLSADAKSYIEKNYGDIQEWVVSAIEAKIYDLKNPKSEDSASK